MERLQPWLLLKSVPGVGNHLFKRLLDCFHTPASVLKAPIDALMQVDGVGERLARRIKSHRATSTLENELLLAKEKYYQIITLNDDDYPLYLKEIPDPPPFLFANGSLQPSAPCVAVVGSRHATDYGLQTAFDLCRALAGLGITIVSGMARGIDTAAHKGALMGGGKTIAVLGSGLERIYPKENLALSRQIASNGAVLSELSLFATPEAHHFPARNRIISGISLGTVVVEATKRSGSLITARLAAEQNREVFAVPGNIRSFKSSGTHALIKEGAKLIEHPQDILDEISASFETSLPLETQCQPMPSPLNQLSTEESLVMTQLEPYPVHIDTIVQKLSKPAPLVSSVLLTLELKGLVRQLPGKQFVRIIGMSSNS